uniref:Uncharacterized protein n=1 Tax=Glossina austeni TaxID=7395 RepID=A0A1A9VIX0_GLOAU
MRSSVNYREREEDEKEKCRHSLKEIFRCLSKSCSTRIQMKIFITHYEAMGARAVAYKCAEQRSSTVAVVVVVGSNDISGEAANKCVVFIVDNIVDIARIDKVVCRIRRPTRRYNFQAAYNDDRFVRLVKINAAAVDVIVVGSCYSLQLVSSSKCMTYFILLLMD